MTHVKPVTFQDASFLTYIRNECKESFYDQSEVTLEQTQQWLKKLKLDFYVIFNDDERVGTISVSKSGEIGNVTILPKWRRNGMLRSAITIMKQLYPGVKFHLDVRGDNLVAIAAYARLGFKVVKTVNHVIMEEI